MISQNEARINRAAFASVAALSLMACGKAESDCPQCGGLNTSCPDGCGIDPETGELNGTRHPTHNPSKGD